MTPDLVILCLAAAAIVAYATSLVAGAALFLARRAFARMAPAAVARLDFLVALAPLVVSVATLLAALSPSFGWIADHCAPASEHSHPHLCAAHHVVGLPGLSMIFLAGLLASRVVVAVTRATSAVARAELLRRALLRDAVLTGGVPIVSLDGAQAFVIGLVRPTVFVTRGLLTPAIRPHLDAVLAHEAAHVRRRDGLRRVLASLAFPFHVPGLARLIERGLERAHEMAADDEAARSIGSRSRVAEAIVAMARARLEIPRGSLAFAPTGDDLAVRVRRLLDDRALASGPSPGLLAVLTSVVLLGIALGADAVHHGVEMTLGLLGG